MGYTRILCLDGGGIRGIIPATLLVGLEKNLQKYSGRPEAHLADFFDLIAGTSTGGILTSIYLLPTTDSPTTSRFSAQEALQFYLNHGTEIFHARLWHSIKNLAGLSGPKYSAQALEELLQYYLKDTLLSELVKPCLVTAYDISNQKSTFFNQLDPVKPHKEDFFIKDLARATSAAPTYFPAAQISSFEGTPFTFIDGGTFANNPTLCAFVEATKLPHHPSLDQMLILSLGTGNCPTPFNLKNLIKGGAIQWALPLLNVFTGGIAETVDTQMEMLFNGIDAPSHYLRIQPNLSALNYPDIPMDQANSSSLRLLKEIGLRAADLYKNQLDAFAQLLVQESDSSTPCIE